MKYTEYPSDKTFVIIHCTGSGAQGDSFNEIGMVYETDDYLDAQKNVDILTKANNTPEEIASTWKSNTYIINVNTNSLGGKEREKEFTQMFNSKLKNGLNKRMYRKTYINGITCYIDKSLPNDSVMDEQPTRVLYSTVKPPPAD